MSPRDPDPYLFGSLPSTAQAYGATRAAIEAYRAWRDDRIFMPVPAPGQVRLVAQYCQDYINAPIFTYPAEELIQLRARIEHIRTLTELAGWLGECRRIGIEPL
jgi:hypothetical protein